MSFETGVGQKGFLQVAWEQYSAYCVESLGSLCEHHGRWQKPPLDVLTDPGFLEEGPLVDEHPVDLLLSQPRPENSTGQVH